MTKQPLKNDPIVIEYYSDILCVWAWIAQRRVDELTQNYGEQLQLHYFNVNIFGDVVTKIEQGWKERGGYKGFAQHVNESASNYEHAIIHPDVWTKTRPTTSANAHLVLKALDVTQGPSVCARFSLIIRDAFYSKALDISELDVLFELIEKHNLNLHDIKIAIHNGSAIAALMKDYQRANDLKIKGSPSYVLDGGRQVLFGNVGYRVLNANIQELIKKPSKEASWC